MSKNGKLKTQKYDKNLYFYWVSIVLYLLVISVLYQIAAQGAFTVLIYRQKRNQYPGSSACPSVSVVICARNEMKNLEQYLPSILNQQHPDFEVIVVDDGSDVPFNMQHERLSIIRLSKEEKAGPGKKYALQKGIEAARNEVIILTDADCMPLSKNWLSRMSACIHEPNKIALGISPYRRQNTFLNGLVEYETAQTALQYAGFALAGSPYMGVGRNVAYDAVLLKSKKWTQEELSIASGDDDLAIQALATQRNTTVCLSADAFTVSDAANNWTVWFRQKLRHYESGKLYKLSHQFLLGIYLFTKLCIYFSILYFFIRAVCVVENPAIFNLPLSLLLLYSLFTLTVNFILNIELQLNSRWHLSFIYDGLYCILTVILGTASRFIKTSGWK